MKIAVIGADTGLGRRIAKEALHRHNEVTAVVKKNDWADAHRYTMVEISDYALKEEGFDAVIDARETTIQIRKGEAVSTLLAPEVLDETGVRQGMYTVTEGAGAYLCAEDLAVAALDDAEQPEGKTFGATQDRAIPQKEDGTGRRRYLAETDRGIRGKVFHILMDNIGEYVVHFTADDTLMLAKKGEDFRTFSCYCYHCDDEVWQAAFMKDDECITLVLDEAQSLVTMVIGTLEPLKPELVHHEFQFGAIQKFNEPVPFRRHGYTDELAGEKICWHYSPYVNITHCYVSENYVRSSLHNMKPVPADAAPEAKFDAEDRVERWSHLFFEEPAAFVRINPHLYVVSFIEAQRNRIDTLQGGGDMVLTVNTRRMHDYGVGFSSGSGRPGFGLVSVHGDFDDAPIPFESEPSPYHI